MLESRIAGSPTSKFDAELSIPTERQQWSTANIRAPLMMFVTTITTRISQESAETPRERLSKVVRCSKDQPQHPQMEAGASPQKLHATKAISSAAPLTGRHFRLWRDRHQELRRENRQVTPSKLMQGSSSIFWSASQRDVSLLQYAPHRDWLRLPALVYSSRYDEEASWCADV